MGLASCDCFDGRQKSSEMQFHADSQDTQCEGWNRLVGLIDEAAADGREELAPPMEMGLETWSQIVTLPATIAKLKSVKRLRIFGSFLVRIPAEIGEMENLELFDVYISHRLHWFPYEITRCTKLRKTAVSIRCLYGNYKKRPAFPRLRPPSAATPGVDLLNVPPATWGTDSIKACSVCCGPVAAPSVQQVWLSLNVGSDVLPLLVNACSSECIRRLPQAADGYVKTPHTGGLDVVQPPLFF